MREEINMTHVGLRTATHEARELARRVGGYVARGEVSGLRWRAVERSLRRGANQLEKLTSKEITHE